MALSLGEITGVLSLDAKGVDKGVGDGLGKLGEFAKAGPLIAVAAGAAIGAALVSAIGDAMDVQAANAKLAAQLGATPEVAAQYGQTAGELYSMAYGESLGGVNDAMRAVVQSGAVMEGASQEQIKNITANALDLAQAFGVDVQESTRAVATMLRTGLAPDAATAMDVLTRGFQGGVDIAGDLLDTFSEYSTQFRKLGLEGDAAMGLLQQGLKGGARDADTVADALKELSIRVVDGSKTTAEGFSAIGLNADEMAKKFAAGGKSASDALTQTIDGLKGMKDPVAQGQAAVALFGTKAEDLGAALYSLDPAHAVEALGQVEGAAGAMGETLHDTAANRIEGFKRSLETGVVNFIGGQVLPALEGAVDWLNTNFGPAWAQVQEWMAPAIDAGRQFLDAMFGEGAPTDAPAWMQPLLEVGGQVRDLFVLLWTILSTQVWPILQQLGTTVAEAVVPIFERLATFWTETLLPALLDFYTFAAEQLVPIFDSISAFVQEHVVPAVQMLSEKFQALWDKAQPVVSVLVSIYQAVAELVVWLASKAVPAVLDFAGPPFDALVWAIGLAIDIISGIIGAIGDLIRWTKQAGQGVADFASWAGQKFDEFKAWAGRAIDGVIDFFRNLPGRILGALSNLGSDLYNAGTSAVRGMINGFGDMTGALASKARDLAASAWKSIKNFFGIKSPSRLMRWGGAMVGEGLVLGLDSQTRAVASAADRLALAALPGLDPLAASVAAAPAVPVGQGATWESVRGAGAAAAPVQINVTNHFPQAEPTSVTTNKALQYAAAVGLGV